jgi:hypothetical protein
MSDSELRNSFGDTLREYDSDNSGTINITEAGDAAQDFGSSELSQRKVNAVGEALDRDLNFEIQGGSDTQEIGVAVRVSETTSFERDRFRNFLTDVSEYFESEGVSLRFDITSYKDYGTNENCVRDASFARNSYSQDTDLAFCVGPGEGGYYGAKTNVVGLNTNERFRFTETGKIAAAHEVIHFLGYQDLYIFPDSMPKKWISDNVMNYIYSAPNKITKSQERILNTNLERLSENRQKIAYPLEKSGQPDFRRNRLQRADTLKFNLDKNTRCRIDELKYSGTEEITTAETGSDGTLEFTVAELDLDTYGGLRFSCGSDTFWAPSPVFDKCYLDQPNDGSCSYSCEEGDWCQLEDLPESSANIDIISVDGQADTDSVTIEAELRNEGTASGTYTAGYTADIGNDTYNEILASSADSGSLEPGESRTETFVRTGLDIDPGTTVEIGAGTQLTSTVSTAISVEQDQDDQQDDGERGGSGGGSTNPQGDTDGDVLVEDVNDDDQTNLQDGLSLLEKVNQGNPSVSKFDHDGDGDVDARDALRLSSEVAPTTSTTGTALGQYSANTDPSTQNIQLDLSSGWSLISVPGIEGSAASIDASELRQKCDLATTQTTWRYVKETDYTAPDSISSGAGVWVNLESSCNPDLSLEEEPVAPAHISFDEAGWHTISVAKPTSIGNIKGTCSFKNLEDYGGSKVITYEDSEYTGLSGDEDLSPKQGYWIKTKSPCQLGSSY